MDVGHAVVGKGSGQQMVVFSQKSTRLVSLNQMHLLTCRQSGLEGGD